MTPSREKCDECGLPIVECSALAQGRFEVESFLKSKGYGSLDARDRALELIPDPKALGLREKKEPPA